MAAFPAEALALGLATGPVCLASCGPVVLPWMMVQPRGVGIHARQMAFFLGSRLAGYLLFASAAWLAGSAIARIWGNQSWLLGGVELILALALFVYAAGWPFRWPRATCPAASRRGAASLQRLVQIQTTPQPWEKTRPRISGAATLGFLTGINLCPPFLIAGMRVAEMRSLPSALLYFVFFFAGTSLWFAPFISLGFVRRTPAVLLTARLAGLLLACWYGFSGASILIEKVVYG